MPPLAVVVPLIATLALADDGVPPFLGNPETLAPEVRGEVAAIWTRRTVTRTVTGQPARVPIELYQLVVDLPEVTAAAGEHLGAGRYRVARRGPDFFDVADAEGATGTYRVIVKRPGERVLLAHVHRRARLLGDVRGATITRLTFGESRDDDGRPVVTQRIETVARIDHRVAAFIARVLVPLFPGYADRKVAEVFTIAARVATWSVDDGPGFCRWLATQPEGGRYRQMFAPHVPACAVPH